MWPSRIVGCSAALLLLLSVNLAVAENDDPDVPAFARAAMADKGAYLRARADEVALRRGISKDEPFDISRRVRALQQLDADERARSAELSAYRWTSVGPEPIPNGQTTAVTTAVSGRTISIAVHPTDPNKVYAGTANGGLYRSLDGGASWKALMDSAQSLAIGAVTLDPANPTTVWVGTGEGNSSSDSFAGVGIYRILNAESASPTIEGPFGGAGGRVAGCGTTASTGIAFLGTAITRIVFDPNNANRMFVSNDTGVAGIGVGVPAGGSNGFIGLWLSDNANAATPTFARCGALGGGNFTIQDLVFEPGSSSNLLAYVIDRSGVGTAHGVHRITNANLATNTPNVGLTATNTLNLTAVNGELAVNKVGSVVTVVVAHGGGPSSFGRVQVSVDGGVTFPTVMTGGDGFCGGQCFYDIAVAIDPSNASRIYIGGSASGASKIFGRSTNGTSFAASENGLHADSHAIAVAPSNPAIVYTGNDGGIFKSTDFGVTWTSLNVSGFNATQFMSLATHASDPEFMIGGTQDNGTEMKRANGTWTRTDFGDGGFALIDQSSTSLASIQMYHTYFNQAGSLMGYARQTSPNAFENWSFRGCGGTANGISCTATAVRFYAPIALGPGTPNTVYYGNDRLYRSADTGTSNALVSQAPIVSGQAISSIGIAPSNDNVRIVGLNNGGIFRTTTGSTTLDDVDTGNVVPSFIVSRAVIDRNNSEIAYVTLSGYTTAGQGIWRTANLSNANPTWTAAANGIPSIPVNAFVIDPRNSAHLYAGTDIGVYRSTNSGANWSSFSVGLPRTPVFDMAFQGATLSSGQHTLRIATHGRGIWEIGIQSPPSAVTEVATNVSRTGATLQGTVNDNLFSSSVSFEYGTTLSYGTTVAASPATVNSNSDTAVSAIIGSLTANTLYHYRVRATNSVGTTLGQDRTFFTNALGLQVGSIVIGATKQADFNRVTRVKFAQQFGATPVVVAQATNEDSDPTALRIINVGPTSFDLLQVEAPGCNGCTGANGTLTVHWIAATPGSFDIPNLAGGGLVQIKAGTVATTATQRNTASGFAGWPATAWQAISFPAGRAPDFSTAPIVLTALQTWNAANEGSNLTPAGVDTTFTGSSQPWGTVVARDVTANGMDVAIESSEVDDDDVAPPGFINNETIGYIAIQSGVAAQISAFGGGSNIGLATGTANVTDACANVDLSFPAGTSITVASLRGFSGKQTRNDADGGWLRRCSLANPSGTTVRMGVRVDEDADIDAERVHATAEVAGSAIFGGDFATTPVTLAKITSRSAGDRLDVDFTAATEIAHLAYRIWGRESALADWRPLHTDLIVSNGADHFGARRYQRSLLAPDVRELRIEDIDIAGRSRFHAAIAIDRSLGADVVDAPLDWAAIRARNVSATRALDAGSVLLADVVHSGIQRVRLGDLVAAGMPLADANPQHLAVFEGAVPLLRHVSCDTYTPQCEIEWVAKQRQSLYGVARAYRIALDPSYARPVRAGATVEAAAATRIVAGEVRIAPNRRYSFSSPTADPWYDERLVATNTPVSLSRSFQLPGRATGPVQMKLSVWGGLDYAGNTPDHSVEVKLNGVTLDQRRFDGLGEETLQLTLPDSLLQTDNIISLTVLADTGYPADAVLLDGFTIDYPRETTMQTDELRFGDLIVSAAQLADVLHGGGFETRSGFALNQVTEPTVIWAQTSDGVRRSQTSAPVALANTQALVANKVSAIHRPALRLGAAHAVQAATFDYLIISHPLFLAELQPLIDLQQTRGLSVRVVSTDEIYARGDHNPDPALLRDFISASDPRFVLLVGGDSYDYANYLGLGSQSFIPTFYRAADPIVRFAATDHPFVDANADGIPERALGRIPARTIDELRYAVSSIVARADLPAQRYLAAAGQSGAAEHFDVHSRSMLSYLRQGQPVQFALHDELDLPQTRARILSALSGDADWINYLGHSSPNRWSFQNVLDTSQIDGLQRSGAAAIVSQWGCWNNYFVLPNQDTMAHALLLRSNRLAALVIGSSSLAEDASHMALGTRFFDLVEDGRFGDSSATPINSIGEALTAAKRNLIENAPEHADSVYSINLFGDPATPIR